MFADLLGRCRSRRRAVDHRCVAVDGGQLAGDRRRDHADVENSAVGKETTDGEVGLEAGERIRRRGMYAIADV